MSDKFGPDAGVNIEAITVLSPNGSTQKVKVPLTQPYNVQYGGNANHGRNQNGSGHGNGYTAGGYTYHWGNQGDRGHGEGVDRW